MKCKTDCSAVEESGKYPCGMCKGVGSNSVLCTKCDKWIHKRCSGVKSKTESNVGYQGPKCSEILVKSEVGSDKKSVMLDVAVEFEAEAEIHGLNLFMVI